MARSVTARRFCDLVLISYIADMGGLDRCSEIRLDAVIGTRRNTIL